MIRYFITYHEKNGGAGNVEIKRTRGEGRIKTMDDIESIEKAISESLNRKVVITGWKRWR